MALDQGILRQLTRKQQARLVMFHLAEERRIHELREGVHSGPSAWVVPDSEDTAPWPLAEDFKIEQLSPQELVIGIDLGILTLDILTADQRAKMLEAREEQVPANVAAGFLGKIAAGTTSH